MRKPTLLLVQFLSIGALITGCMPTSQTDQTDTNSSSASSESVDFSETHNVTYRGQLEEAGISVYQEGTHRLTLSDGKFILLESESVSLDAYLANEVEVTGSLRPTVEAGGMIMRVESIYVTDSSSVSSVESSASSESSVAVSSAAVSSAKSVASVAPVSSAAVVSSTTPVSSVAASSVAAGSEGDVLAARVEVMAKNDISPANWSRQYCTQHIGFCFPVHKNWWFNSFGATTSILWHVEIGPEEISTLGSGPISVNLIAGSVESKKAADRQVRTQGSTVIGFRSWTDNRHFEIVADAKLEAAVRYITENIISYEPEE